MTAGFGCRGALTTPWNRAPGLWALSSRWALLKPVVPLARATTLCLLQRPPDGVPPTYALRCQFGRSEIHACANVTPRSPSPGQLKVSDHHGRDLTSDRLGQDDYTTSQISTLFSGDEMMAAQRRIFTWTRTNPAGSAIVNAVGPIRQLVEPRDEAVRRYLVVATAGDGVTPVVVQVQVVD